MTNRIYGSAGSGRNLAGHGRAWHGRRHHQQCLCTVTSATHLNIDPCALQGPAATEHGGAGLVRQALPSMLVGSL